MIHSAFFSPGNKIQYLSTTTEIKNKLKSEDGFVWVSMESASEEEIHSILRDTFNFHPLTIEDCLSSGYQTSKIDDFLKYIFIISHAVTSTAELEGLNPFELDLFLGSNYLITCYTDPIMPPIEQVWSKVEKDFRLTDNGPDFLCHAILDHLVDAYMPLIDQMETDVELLEESILEKPTPEILARLLSLKHDILSMRRIVGPQREVMNRLARDDFEQIDHQSKIYFRDIYDHLVRIQELTDTIRDIVSGSLDIYLNSTSLRLNAIMKALTIVSTIFLPLSFIAGAFGMNFTHIPWATGKFGFYGTCIAMVVIGVGMLLYFRMRNWF